jgi:tetratricopeptide (TPR) repeat protein
MASRVNIRFVVILAGALATVFVLTAGVFYFVKMRSGSRYAYLGDQALARGDIKAADEFYSKAVSKEHTNVEYLKKWRSILEKKIPETDTQFVDGYRMYTAGVLSSLATLQRSDVNAQTDYLQALYEEHTLGIRREGYEHIIEQVNTSLAFFEPDQPAAIRRYRGLATLGLQSVGAEVKPDQLDQGAKDLEAAIAANPKDTEAADGLMLLHRAAALKAKERSDQETYGKRLEQARQVVAASLAANPGDPQSLVDDLLLAATDADAAPANGSAAEQAQARRAAIRGLAPRLAAASEQMVKADPARLNTSIVSMFATLASMIDPAEAPKQSMALIKRALEGAPDNADLMMLGARLAVMQGDLNDAIARYDAVIKLPKRPISLAGIRLGDIKRKAQFLLTNSTVGLAATAPADSRATAMDRAKQAREQLAQVVADQSPELKLIDGKLLLVNGDLRGAQQYLSDFIRTPGDVGAEQLLDARLLIGDIAMRLDPPQPGLARESYRAVLDARPDLLNVRMALAGVELLLENRSTALELYKQVLAIDPKNDIALRQVQVLENRTDDPVLKVLIDADRLSRGATDSLGDNKAALALVEGALEANAYDMRLVTAAVTLHANTADYAGARQIVAAALQRRPADEKLKALMKRLEVADSYEGMIALIEEGSGSPLDKWLAKRRVSEAFGKKAEAEASLKEAATIAPDDGRVLELQFVAAILGKDMPQATRLAERAIQVNADRADGDTFRARLMISQGNLKEAASLLERASQRGNANPAIYRMLGALQMQLGRGPEAVNSYRRAMELNPADVVSVKSYLTSLVQTGQRQTALGVARASEAIGRRDPEFFDMWLELEADAGRLQFARERREEMHTLAPSDVPNTTALADLYIREQSFDKARPLIDDLRSKNDSIAAAVLDARWYAGKGDIAKASDTFKSYVAKVQGAERSSAYMAYGQFMIQAGRLDDGLAAFRQATDTQDPKSMPVDLTIGEILLSHGRFADAESQFRKVLDAGVADPQLQIHKRLIEAQIQQGNFKEAEKEFAGLGADADRDVELIAQRSQLLRDLGRSREARDLLDRAIEKFPDEPLPYLRRARLVMTDPAYTSDAMADLATAIKLRPTFWQALRTRAQLLIAAGKYDEAIRDLQAAAESAPGLDEIRFNLIDLQLTQNRDADAGASADAGIKLHTNDLRYTASLADRFAGAGRWAKAAELYRLMLKQRPDETAASACVNALLKGNPPAVTDAEAVLATPGLDIEKSWRLLIARASIRKQQGKDGPMQADCVAALELVSTPDDLIAGFEAMRRVVGKPATIIEIVDRAWASRKIATDLSEWMVLARSTAMLDEPSRRSEGCAQLQSMAGEAKNPGVRVNASKAAAAALANDSRWDDAVKSLIVGLAVVPEDVVFNNNIAYMLSENLHKPADALPYAEKAFHLAPDDLNVIDTMATVYWSKGDREKAVETAGTGLRAPRADADKAPLALKLAGWRLQTGDKTGAKALLDFLLEVLTDNPALNAKMKPNVDQLKKDIDAAA